MNTITNELLSRGDWHINATITFRYDVTEQQAFKSAHLLLNKLDKHYFGNARRKKIKVKRISALHDDSYRRHYHILFELPKNISFNDFKYTLHHLANQRDKITHKAKLPTIGTIEVETTDTQAGSIFYNLRLGNSRTTAFDPIGSHF